VETTLESTLRRRKRAVLTAVNGTREYAGSSAWMRVERGTAA